MLSIFVHDHAMRPKRNGQNLADSIFIYIYWQLSFLRWNFTEVGQYHGYWCPAFCHHQFFSDHSLNTLRPRQNGRHYPDDIFKCIFMNEKFCILIRILLKFVPKGLIDNKSELIQEMAWHRSGDEPLSESMVVSLLRHICVTWPEWVNQVWTNISLSFPREDFQMLAPPQC